MSSIDVFIHPQAMLVLSDHFSRLPYDLPESPLPIDAGFLLGNYDGPQIVVTNAFEIVTRDRNGKIVLDREFLSNQLDLHNSIYPNDQPIGWYVLKKHDHSELIKVAEALKAFDKFEYLLFGEFLPNENGNSSPFRLYTPKGNEFVPIEFTYESHLAENISMLTLQSEGNAESQIQFTAKAFHSLDMDLETIEKYLVGVRDGKIPFDSSLMLNCANIAQFFNDTKRSGNNTEKNEEEDDEYDEDAFIEEQATVGLLAGSLLQIITTVLDRK